MSRRLTLLVPMLEVCNAIEIKILQVNYSY
jgi:hypothetical protein